MTTFEGFDVLEVEPNWRDGIGSSFRRSSHRLDSGFGNIINHDKAGVGALDNGFSWFMENRTAINEFKAFVAARKGATVPFWFPTWRSDLQLYANALSSDTNLNVSFIGFTKFVFPNPARRFLAILLPDGSKIYRRITVATDPGNGLFETITIDSSPGVALTASTVILSFLLLCRLTDDRSTMRWHSLNVGEADLSFMEVSKEVP